MKARPRLLDLCCGEGGASVGYARAGFEVTGVDIKRKNRYPFTFIQADALEFLQSSHRDFDVIHASPPCQRFTRASHLRKAQGLILDTLASVDLLEQVMAFLKANVFIPWVVENVPGSPLVGITLCGSSFGLGVRRHRVFASNLELTSLPCRHKEQGRPWGVYHRFNDEIPAGGRMALSLAHAKEVMGIDWDVTGKGIFESIPPAYTEHIGKEIMHGIQVDPH